MNRKYTFAFGLLAMVAIATVAVLGFDVHAIAYDGQHDSLLRVAEFGIATSGTDIPKELKAVFDRIGEAFEAFKKSHDEEIVGIKKGFSDVVTTDKLTRINEALDKSVEAKAALDAKIEAERKHVDELEKKLNKLGLSNDDQGKRTLELKIFNGTLAALAADRKKAFTQLDETGLDAYKAAFDHYTREGKENLSNEEVKTLSAGSDPDGGYFVTPDVTGGIVKKVYETSPVRQLANVRTISTDSLEGIEDLGEAGAGYAGEHTVSGDGTTPQVGKWKIDVHNLDTEPKVTQQLLDDAVIDVEGWLSEKIGAKFGRFENKEFVTGAAGKIRGFLAGYPVAADDGSGVDWGKIGYVGTGVNGDFAATTKGDKLHDLMGLLKNEYLPGAVWMTRRSVITTIRKFKDGQGNYLWQPSFVAGQPETILGHAVSRMEDFPVLATGSLSLAFGDLKQAYLVIDRQGIRVLRDPYTAKGYIKFYTTKRTGGGVVNFEAIKLMKFS